MKKITKIKDTKICSYCNYISKRDENHICKEEIIHWNKEYLKERERRNKLLRFIFEFIKTYSIFGKKNAIKEDDMTKVIYDLFDEKIEFKSKLERAKKLV